MQKETNKELFTSTEENITIGDIAVRWLENSKLRVKESTYVKYRNQVDNHILPVLGGEKLCEFTTFKVENFVRESIQSGKKNGRGGLSGKTVKDMLAVLKSICLYGEQSGYDIPCRMELVRIHCTVKEPLILDRKQCDQFEEYLFRDDDPMKTGIILSLYMGLRIGEVCALKREHIRYEEQVLRVRFTMQRIQDFDGEGAKTKVIVTEPKSRNGVRDIPIPDFLMDRLYRYEELPDNIYLLTGRTDKFIEPRTMENTFKRFLADCRIQGVTFHALRHTFATRCIERGFDVKTLSEILGHSNANITLNRYVHSSMEMKKENMGKLRPSALQAVSHKL